MAAKKKLLLSLLVVVAVAGAGLYWWKSRPVPVTYRETRVKRADLAVTILSTGTVQPENRLEIKPPVAGRVERVLVTEGQKVAKGATLAWLSSTERAALIDAARTEGPEELKRWEENYRPTPVIAPLSGTIILRNVESGQTVVASDVLLAMSDRLTVKAQVDETDIAQIKLKQPAEIILDAYAGEKIPAKVDQIAFEAKTVNNVTTYVVDVLPLKTPDFMRSGMTANVTFKVDTREEAIVVPADAVTYQSGSARVQVRGPAGEPVSRPVKIGVSDGKQIEILEGVEPDEVVLSSQVTVKGARARPTSPFMGGTPPRSGGGGRGH